MFQVLNPKYIMNFIEFRLDLNYLGTCLFVFFFLIGSLKFNTKKKYFGMI